MRSTTNFASSDWEDAKSWAALCLVDFQFSELSPNTYLFHGSGFEYRTVVCVTPKVSGSRYIMCAGDAGELIVQLRSDADPLYWAAKDHGPQYFLEKVTPDFRVAEFSKEEWQEFLAYERKEALAEEDEEDRKRRLSRVDDMDQDPETLDAAYEIVSASRYDDPPDFGVVPKHTLRMVALLQAFARLYVRSQDTKESE